MLKKTMTYTDFDGNSRTEDFFFNLTKAELFDMDVCVSGGMDNLLRSIINERDNFRIVEIFKKFINASYGKKSNDGKYFEKSPEILAAFTHTQAYSDLYIGLLEDSAAAAAFLRGIFPPDVVESADKLSTTGSYVS